MGSPAVFEIQYVTKNDLGLLILLPPPSKEYMPVCFFILCSAEDRVMHVKQALYRLNYTLRPILAIFT